MTKPNNTETLGPGPHAEPMHAESGFREPFVEVPADRLPNPEVITPEQRQRRAFENAFTAALSQLTEDSHVDSAEQFHEKLGRVSRVLVKDDVYSDDQLHALYRTVLCLGWLMMQRIEQLRALRCYVLKLCPRSLAEKVLWEGTERRFRKPDAKAPPDDQPSCSGDEHVYEPGEPRCDCGKVTMRRR